MKTRKADPFNPPAALPEEEIARWVKSLRKDGLGLTQRELSEKTGIPLGTVRYFEQTGQIGFSAFLRIARALHALEPLLALARNEEPETFHKIQKEKTISRLKDEIAMLSGNSTPEVVRRQNSATEAPIRLWKLAGRSKWMRPVSSPEPI